MLDSNLFPYCDGTLHCEGVSLEKLAEEYGTPLFVTSRNSLINQYRAFEKAFAGLDHFTCYSVKANFNLHVIRTLSEEGCGCDVNSGGELFRALQAGVEPGKIIMAGVGKTASDIEYGVKSGIVMLKAESVSELRLVNDVAGRLGMKASVGIRVNPNVTAETHPYITTGDSKEKFGIDEADLDEVFDLLKTLEHVDLTGLDMHIGSQIFDANFYEAALEKLLDVLAAARSAGFDIRYFDIGGGFPVTYEPQKPATPIGHFAEKLIPLVEKTGATILFEPGRFIVANSTVLLTKVLYRKQNHAGKEFVIVDAGMTELIRPALYQSYHEIVAVSQHNSVMVADIVGPVCESGDFFARERTVDRVKEGELLAVLSAGAYGSVMSNNYNGRLRPAEVMVDGDNAKLIRKRDSFEQLIQNEVF
ncbi:MULTISPECIES: diaminopimelate decarboxylase [unclassified Prosthecochloris]|uniref:diaminopimelate decarboxylase n=1 Tax=unclassified Prosthecochloris TaxID=2632826 RepID=UPI00223CF14F|nr:MULTISPECIES: diaminopimelate decarboxylase [unclassified Prosthecochloris]UZJ39633.1 diaminopimelate decarboxylase [Prosthecochloris sp. SCSIO W1102]